MWVPFVPRLGRWRYPIYQGLRKKWSQQKDLHKRRGQTSDVSSMVVRRIRVVRWAETRVRKSSSRKGEMGDLG